MYVAIAANSLAEKAGPLIEKFREHHTRVDNTRLWGSVFDNATFVLCKYQARAGQSEAAAAKQLLDALGSLAGRAAASASTGGGATKDTPKAAPAANTKAARKVRKTMVKAKPAGGARTQQGSTPKRKR
jgi:hypothetical protein